MSVKSDGDIEFINQAGKNLFGISNAKNLKDLNKVDSKLHDHLMGMEFGCKQVIDLQIKGELLKLSFAVKDVKIKDEAIKIFSFQNIRTELENEELEAWQKLIKVLRHEIMNSITPVKSLSYSILKSFDKIKKNDYIIDDKPQMDKVFEGMHAIHSRSVGMMDFIESYREITKVMIPMFADVDLSGLVTSVVRLFDEEISAKKVIVDVDCPANITLQLDEKLVSQVLINLIKNAIEAFDEISESIISIRVVKTEQNTEINVIDNGNGIPQDLLADIFVPFFTTKEKGSGIGLSLSREIMRKHKGSISIKSQEGKGTNVILRF